MQSAREKRAEYFVWLVESRRFTGMNFSRHGPSRPTEGGHLSAFAPEKIRVVWALLLLLLGDTYEGPYRLYMRFPLVWGCIVGLLRVWCFFWCPCCCYMLSVMSVLATFDSPPPLWPCGKDNIMFFVLYFDCVSTSPNAVLPLLSPERMSSSRSRPG